MERDFLNVELGCEEKFTASGCLDVASNITVPWKPAPPGCAAVL